jgi:hypothetical protein
MKTRAVLTLLLVGCGHAESGDYTLTHDPVEGDCPLDPVIPFDETMTVTVASDNSQVTLLDVPIPLQGSTFEGAIFDDVTDYHTSGLDAVVTRHDAISGRWGIWGNLSGTLTWDLSCDGDYCDTLEVGGVAFCAGSVKWKAKAE